MFRYLIVILLFSQFSKLHSKQKGDSAELKLIEQCLYWDGRDSDSLSYYTQKLKEQDASGSLEAYQQYLFGRSADSNTLREQYFRKTVFDAVQDEDYPLVAQAYYRLGRIFRSVGAYDSARIYYQLAHDFFDRNNTNSLIEVPRRRCVLFTSQAFISNRLNNYESSIEYSLSSLRIAEEHAFKDLKLISLINLGASYGELQSFNLESGDRFKFLSRDYMLEAARLAEDLGDKRRLNRSYGNIGIYYYDEGLVDSAKYFLIKAVSIGDEIADHFGLTNHHNILGTIAREENQLLEAEFHTQKAMESAVATGSERMEADIMLTLAELRIANKDFKSAKIYLNRSLSISERLGTPKISASGYQRLYEVALKEDRKGLALDFYQKHISYRDSIVNIDNLNRIEELRTQYESEKKEQQIASLEQEAVISDLQIEQQRIFMHASILVILIGGVAGYFFYRNRNLSSIQQRLMVEQKLLRSQMNPHFLFNALSSVHGFIYEGEKEQAAEYLSLFSELTRDYLVSSSEEYITLKKELTTLSKFVEIQKVRFPGISYEVKVAEDLDAEDVAFPPMLLQPFVENAIEHGLKGQETGKISMSIRKDGECLDISIQNDGNGLGKSGTKEHKSRAIAIATERLALLPGVKKARHTVSVEDREKFGEKGVLVKMRLPYLPWV